MTVKEYLTIARERWFIIVVCVLIGLGCGGAAAFLVTPQYSASTKFYIATRDLGNDLNQAYQGSLLSEQKIKSYVDLAADRRIREQVSAKLGYPLRPGVIKASAKPETVLLTLTATDPSPRRAQLVANLAAVALSELVAEVEKPSGGEPVVVARQIQEAQLPTTPVSPQQKTSLAIGLFLGLLLGMAGAVLRHGMDRTIKSPQALSDLVGAPVLGATQWDPRIKSRPLIVHDEPRAPLAEAFRQLRTNLEYVDLDHSNKLICVTSALPHEGKTTTACNLAIALAQAGNRVVIVEADLRRPMAAQYMGMENAVGLTTVLTNQVSLDVALQPWGGGILDFLGSGALPPNPSELLASAQMAAVLAELNTRYDVVILDAAPTLPVADGAALAAQCHGVLFVSRHGWVRSEQVKAAAETLRRVSAPVFGVVLAMVPRTRGGSSYSSYQYSYTPDRSRRPAPQRAMPPAVLPVNRAATDDGHRTVPAPRPAGAGQPVLLIDSGAGGAASAAPVEGTWEAHGNRG